MLKVQKVFFEIFSQVFQIKKNQVSASKFIRLLSDF